MEVEQGMRLDECAEAYEFLDNFDTQLIDRLYEHSLIAPRWTMLDYVHYDYNPLIPVTYDIIQDFIDYVGDFVVIFRRFEEALLRDPNDYTAHTMTLRELLPLFDTPLVPYDTLKKFRYTMDVVRYHNFFIQCYLRVFVFESMDELYEWYKEHKDDEASLEDMLEEMKI